MVMLTGGQFSMAISSFIVFFFTLLLFAAGYILQQQSVTSLRRSIAPRIPKPLTYTPPKLQDRNPLARSARIPGQQQSSDGVDEEVQRYLDTVGRGSVNWQRLAHVQLVRTHHEVCSAIMLFAELKRLKSPARRILLFPKYWTRDIDSEEGDVELVTTRRLLRTAARRYHVDLRVLEPIGMGEGGKGGGKKEDDPGSYSLAALWSFGEEFERVLYLRTPGLLLDSEPLDALLAFEPPSPLAVLPFSDDVSTSSSGSTSAEADTDTDTTDISHLPQISTTLLLLTPSLETYNSLLSHLTSTTSSHDSNPFSSDAALLQSFFSPSPSPSSASRLLTPTQYFSPLTHLASTHQLRLIPPPGSSPPPSNPLSPSLSEPPIQPFNKSLFLDTTSYITFSDPELPGPEYDVSYAERAKIRPSEREAGTVWERVYAVFGGRRGEVCGLGLESWEGEVEQGKVWNREGEGKEEQREL